MLSLKNQIHRTKSYQELVKDAYVDDELVVEISKTFSVETSSVKAVTSDPLFIIPDRLREFVVISDVVVIPYSSTGVILLNSFVLSCTDDRSFLILEIIITYKCNSLPGPRSLMAPQPTIVHNVFSSGPHIQFLLFAVLSTPGKHIGLTQRLNWRGAAKRSNAISLLIVKRS
uniref:Uncharacterized protein n=1 Tax=Glossina austeni TaxID=7395 RepID=A0A1A9V3X1_GLOAU